MLRPVSTTEHLLFTTTKIETRLGGGSEESGTGFLYRQPISTSGQSKVFLFTNTHLLDGAVSATFYLRFAAEDAGFPSPEVVPIDIPEPARNAGTTVHHHPDFLDLCAVDVTEHIRAAPREIFFKALSAEHVPSQEQLEEEVSAAESVLMVGHPRGLADEVTKLPLIRRGITSFHPAIDFGGKPCGVVDMACYPGSSGSPILIVDPGGYWSKDGTTHTKPGRMYFLGVLYESPLMLVDATTSGQAGPYPTQGNAVVKHLIHLGYYVKAREVVRLAEEMIARLA